MSDYYHSVSIYELEIGETRTSDMILTKTIPGVLNPFWSLTSNPIRVRMVVNKFLRLAEMLLQGFSAFWIIPFDCLMLTSIHEIRELPWVAGILFNMSVNFLSRDSK